ncbi:hypothetical protein [Streptomyces griseocarneus]|uniref:hypothetical protein n=1 Tax=Streptomyces griseocarneus TaxID=51201 RepID=UPI001F6112DE|nr:hypothetical protein [Streptomyces griseocarneus]
MTIWPATVRYALEAAPGGLGLVQDLLNTAAVEGSGHGDLLAGPDTARPGRRRPSRGGRPSPPSPCRPWPSTPTASRSCGPSATTFTG